MKKVQKLVIIQDARRFGVLYAFLHSTSSINFLDLIAKDIGMVKEFGNKMFVHTILELRHSLRNNSICDSTFAGGM